MKRICKKILAVVGTAGASVGSAFATYSANYTAEDLPSIFTDNLGTGAVNFKTYMPLFVLFLVISVAGLVWTKIRGTFR